MKRIRRRYSLIGLVGALCASGVLPANAVAQSANDLAAFSALIVSPVGALPPVVGDNGSRIPERASLSLRYGGWQYDVDDGMHNNVGLTLTSRIGSSRTSLSATAAHLSLNCACAVWASGGVSVRSVPWSSTSRGPKHPAAHVAIEVAVGGARYMGGGHATARSAAAVLDIGGGIPFFGGSRLSVSVLPGLGRGSLWSADATGGGTRALLGAGASWIFPHGVSIDVGTQRVILPGGPRQIGAGLSLHG